MFRDRSQVGQLLADRVIRLQEISEPIVFAIPRGGVPVAKEIAVVLGAPLDLVITRKIGCPGQPEFAVGAVSQDGEVIINQETVSMLGISEKYLHSEASRQTQEIHERMRKYLGYHPFSDLRRRSVIIVDDGVATGNTMIAAIRFLRRKNPKNIIVAVGVAPPETVTRLARVADKVVCLETPEPFFAIGEFYENFEQVEDEEVKRILFDVNSKHDLQKVA